MKRKFRLGILVVLLIVSCVPNSLGQSNNLKLWYTTPARQWKEALPIGNGRLGTMIAGNVASETLVINEETIWAGGIQDYSNPVAYEHLSEIRKFILQQKIDEAQKLGDKFMIGKPRRQQMYQPLGKLIFDIKHSGNISDYKRTLNLDSAIVTIQYNCKGYHYKREYFASYPDEVLMMRFSTDNPAGLEMNILHSSEHESKSSCDADKITLSGKVADTKEVASDIHFTSQLQVLQGNRFVHCNNSKMVVKGAKDLVLAYTAASNFVSYNNVSGNPEKKCAEILSKVQHKNYGQLKAAHVADYSKLFKRVSFTLSRNEKLEVPTSKLVERAKSGESVPQLDELFYQMGRYLTIAGSRRGGQPLNLQGIWNDAMKPSWGAKWTLNINLPLNYWLTEAANLPECHEPLFDLIRDLSETGAKVAQTHYRCRGFVVHHNTDLWRGAAPVDGAKWGLWPYGGAWLTRHIWEHYQYSQDENFLREYYPLLKQASLFFFDYLSQGKDEYLVANPSISFEQPYYLPGEEREKRLCEGETMGNQIIRDLFTNCFEAARILNDNPEFMDSLRLMRDKLRPTTIDAQTGEIMEWAWPARAQLGRGQLAPLWGLSPGAEFNPIDNPDLAAAALKTMTAREPFIKKYEASGSWVSGTYSNFYARLGEGEKAYQTYLKLVKEDLLPNLLATFYTKKVFQIDGNLGVAAAFNEMLLQSHRRNEQGDFIIDLLPALPDAWPNGSIKGIKARGGFELNFSWKNGELRTVNLTSLAGKKCELHYKNMTKTISVLPGEKLMWNL